MRARRAGLRGARTAIAILQLSLRLAPLRAHALLASAARGRRAPAELVACEQLLASRTRGALAPVDLERVLRTGIALREIGERSFDRPLQAAHDRGDLLRIERGRVGSRIDLRF